MRPERTRDRKPAQRVRGCYAGVRRHSVPDVFSPAVSVVVHRYERDEWGVLGDSPVIRCFHCRSMIALDQHRVDAAGLVKPIARCPACKVAHTAVLVGWETPCPATSS